MPAADASSQLSRWVDPALAFTIVQNDGHAFWLDAGPNATSGWSWIGTGTPVDGAEVRAVSLDVRGASDGSPFRGGYVGWFGYEPAADAAGALIAHDATAGDRWMRVEMLLGFDHAHQRVWVLRGIPETIERALGAADDLRSADVPKATARARVTPAAYRAQIEACRETIRRGDAYLMCLTTRFTVDGDFDAVAVHAALRAANPSHHGALIRFGDTTLVSASPERFLDVSEGIVRTRPIKGTRPRGTDAPRDDALKLDLQRDPKERAENVMIVDLMRNDLARVCDPATVTVERLLEIETYASVHQLVSTIAGRPHPGTRVGDLLNATFPAGSMTGAPKLSAMTHLHRLEQAPRGAFAGCFGWVGDDGSLDLAMTIRSILIEPDAAYVGAGGGITWSSDADAEVAEVALKATAPLRALGADLPEGWAEHRSGNLKDAHRAPHPETKR